MSLGKGSLKSAGTFSLIYNLPYWWLKVSKKYSNMGDLSKRAEIRLKIINAYYILKNVNIVCQIFSISRKTFYKWKRRYEKGEENFPSLKIFPKLQLKKERDNLILRLKSE